MEISFVADGCKCDPATHSQLPRPDVLLYRGPTTAQCLPGDTTMSRDEAGDRGAVCRTGQLSRVSQKC